ncbi:MAG: MbnP family protein [Bacteroidota bacterium]
MPRILTFLLFLSFSILFWGCPSDDDSNTNINDANVEINFRAQFDGQDLQLFSERYDYAANDTRLLLTLFQFYVSDLQLVPTDGGEAITLTEIELVRWNESSDPSTLSFNYTDIPEGSYTIRFGLGVKPELNNTNPSEFAADFVLNENEFWNEMARYVFTKIEGNAELEDDDMFDTPVSYHIGKNDFYVTLDYPDATIDVSPDLTNEIDFTVDVERMMAANETIFADYRDEDTRIVHNPNSPISAQLWANLQQAILLIR